MIRSEARICQWQASGFAVSRLRARRKARRRGTGFWRDKRKRTDVSLSVCGFGMNCGLRLGGDALGAAGLAGLGLLGQNLVGVVFKSLGFGQEGQRLLNFGIPVGQRAQPLQLA